MWISSRFGVAKKKKKYPTLVAVIFVLYSEKSRKGGKQPRVVGRFPALESPYLVVFAVVSLFFFLWWENKMFIDSVFIDSCLSAYLY